MQRTTAPRAGRLGCAIGAGRTGRALAASLVLALAGWAGTPAARAESPRVAIVDGEPIGADAFILFLRRYASAKLYHGGTAERLLILGEEARDTMIAERLLLQEADRRGLEPDRDEVARTIARLRGRHGSGGTDPGLDAALAEAERNLLTDSRIRALRTAVTRVAPPGEADLRAFHARRPELFTEPAAVDLHLVMLPVPPSASTADWQAAERRAAGFRAEIAAGETPFEVVAERESGHGSARKGGNVGRVHTGQLPDAAQAVVAGMEPGDLSQPIRVLEGVLLIRLDARHAARQRPFEAVRDRAAALYVRERGKEQWDALVERLHADAKIVTFDVAPHVSALAAGARE